ncbi:MAG: hypothetical protein NC429_11340 [Lachnospiraceae bacterium]|nr:hypothetical protein [Lachnospiraceae bacterium]
MLTKDFKEKEIRELHKIGKQLENVDVKIPSIEEQEEAKKIIEQILPPKDKGYVTMNYVRDVLIGLGYAEKHFRHSSMLDDIKENTLHDISEYK